jgi:hypothetical protein
MGVRRCVVLLLSLGCTLTLWSTAAFAQDASVNGSVTDESKAVLVGVTMTATNLETGTQSVAVSDDHGAYRFASLPAGKYKLQTELNGFVSVVIPSVELLVGQNATVPFTLKMAAVSESVTVVVGAPLVDTSSNQVAGNVDRRQMEQLPLQGRNWMELSKLVKGITANDVTNTPGVTRDDDFQLNLDGQQITQKVANSGFGQPKFSRESVAEFQIITNMFDVTQGRSAGIQVQAITRSGTNDMHGSGYGYFRDDSLNAKDHVAGKVLPYQNQQVGGTLGGPIVKDKMHYFASYEYEREPGSLFTAPASIPGQNFTIPYKNTQRSFLARVDDAMSASDRLSIRASRWDFSNPFVLAAGGHPSNSSVQDKKATNVLGTWSRVLSDSKIQEIKIGYNNFDWSNLPQPSLANTIEYDFPGLIIGKPYNYPQLFHQNNIDARYDLTWHKGSHDLKIGAEYLYAHDTGTWYIQQVGRMTLSSVPADLASRIPADAWNDPSRWNLAGLDGIVTRFDKNFHPSDWGIDVPRPTYAVWYGDTWHLGSQFTLNYGMRWDDDWAVASPPNVVTNVINIDNGKQSGDFGYKDNIHDHTNFAPRAGFVYNVNDSNNFTIRGGTGLYYTSPVSNMTFSPQLYSQMVTASFPNDGKPGFILDPTRGISTYDQALAVLPAQSPRIISTSYKNPYTWQSSIGFQKQLNGVTGLDMDLTHYNEYHDTRTIDPNLFFDPVTGYNRNPSLGRPNPSYTQIAYFTSDGKRDQTMLSMGLNRRFKGGVQGGLTYAYMFSMHDDGNIGYTAPGANNQFDYLDGEYATSTDFQRHTLRTWVLLQMPWGLSSSVAYFYGSGNFFATSINTAPYGKPGTNRLNLTSTGAAAATIIVPQAMQDRYLGDPTIASGAVIPRNALQGLPLHKVDLRLQKDFALVGRLKASVIAEIYNAFDHANYGAYSGTLSTNIATLQNFGTPAQNLGNAYVPREGQLAFRLGFE